MKELTLQYFSPEKDDRAARLRILYRENERDRGQEETVDFPFVVDPKSRELLRWYLEEYLLAPYGVFADRAKGIRDGLPAIGEGLFRAVFSTEKARNLYGNVQNDLANTRIVIDAESPAGVSLPWELIRDPARNPHGELIRHAFAFVRGDGTRVQALAPDPDGTVLNILYVLCRPDGEEDVPFHAVARPLVRLLRGRDDVHFEVLRPATYAQFAETLRLRPGYFQIVHFDGHGFFPNAPADGRGRTLAASDTEGRVFFEDGARTGTELAAALVAGNVPVILLNACRSATTMPGAAFPSIANQILHGGGRSVVAMGYSVYVDTATRYMSALYERLLSGDELAQAHKNAVLRLRDAPARTTARGNIAVDDWMVPLLFGTSPVQLARKREGIHLTASKTEMQAGFEVEMPEQPLFGFIGRDGDLLRLERAFQKHNVVLLWGMAGVGKTETAAAFARWLADTGALGGPIFFFSFEQKTTVERVLDTIGKTFQPLLKQNGIEWEHVIQISQRRQLVVDLLRQIPCFVLFDNFEPVAGFPAGTNSDWTAQDRDDLRQFILAAAGGLSRVLVTSRRDEPWLRLPGAAVELAGLRQLEAEQLAFAVLQRAGISEKQIQELPDLTSLLKYLQGNPLAIQVILPELARQSPQNLEDQLRNGEAKLWQDDATLGRSRSLAASLTYRLDRLDPGLRERISVLGLFSGFVDADVLFYMGNSDAAPAILRGRSSEAWRSDLDRAAEVGLLRKAGSGCYKLHPALPWFFHDGFEENFGEERTAFERCFATVYAGYVIYLLGEPYQRQRQTVGQLLRMETNNLVAANRCAIHHGDEDTAASVFHQLGAIAEERRDFAEAERWYRQALEIEQRLHNEHSEAPTLHQLGMIAQERRDFAEAERWYLQALEIQQRLNNEHGEAITAGQLGLLADEMGDRTEAVRWLRLAEQIFVGKNDPGFLSLTRRHISAILAKTTAGQEQEESVVKQETQDALE